MPILRPPRSNTDALVAAIRPSVDEAVLAASGADLGLRELEAWQDTNASALLSEASDQGLSLLQRIGALAWALGDAAISSIGRSISLYPYVCLVMGAEVRILPRLMELSAGAGSVATTVHLPHGGSIVSRALSCFVGLGPFALSRLIDDVATCVPHALFLAVTGRNLPTSRQRVAQVLLRLGSAHTRCWLQRQHLVRMLDGPAAAASLASRPLMLPWWMLVAACTPWADFSLHGGVCGRIRYLLPPEHRFGVPLGQEGLLDGLRRTTLLLRLPALLALSPYPGLSFGGHSRLLFWGMGARLGGVLMGVGCHAVAVAGLAGLKRAMPRSAAARLSPAEQRLRRQLQRSMEHATRVRATIDVSTLQALGDLNLGGPAMPALASNEVATKLGALRTALAEIQPPGQRRAALAVDRAHLEGSLADVARLPTAALRAGAMRVTFKGENGIDAGGLRRDYLNSMGAHLSQSSLFVAGPDGALLPQPQSGDDGPWREQLFACGRLLAFAITARTPLPVAFGSPLFKLLAGEKITLVDVAKIDDSFARNHIGLLLSENGVAQVETVMFGELYFVGPSSDGSAEEELIRGGAACRVTEENKLVYASLLIEHYLIGRCRRELALFASGFHDIIPRQLLRGLAVEIRAVDLEILAVGVAKVRVADFRAHAEGSLDRCPRLQRAFWEVLQGFDAEDRARLLAFATGSGRLPAGGFAALRPAFTVDIGGEVDQLPTAHTCVNQLVLPPYETKGDLRKKLLIAIRSGDGFGFA